MASSSSPVNTTSREDKVYCAKLAEQSERYDEMRSYMKSVAEGGEELTVEERNLLSVAYKNAVGSRRASWRIISSVEDRKKVKGQSEFVQLANEFRKKVEIELMEICSDILTLLDSSLIPSTNSAEPQVFFYKMKGDYFRYISEFSDSKKESITRAEEAYEEATKIAQDSLPSTHPIRLGLALNFSVFYYEILNNPKGACTMAKKAFDEAIAKLDTVSEDSYRDSTLIMHLLRDNLTLWNPSENNEEEEEERAVDEGVGEPAS